MKRIIPIVIFLTLVSNTLYSQTVAVELEKMNILYVGVDNPMTIAVESYPCEKIIVMPSHGIIRKSVNSSSYYYKTDSCSVANETIIVGILLEESIEWLDTLEYRVKRVPDPIISIGGRSGGLINKNIFMSSAILANMVGFDFDCAATVTSYSYEIWRRDSLICKETNIEGCVYSEKLRIEIQGSEKGDRYVFFDVWASMSMDNCKRQLQSTEFIVEGE